MRLDELRAQLHDQADRAASAGHDRPADRLEHVRGRVQRIRRRRTAATAAGTAAAVALVAVTLVPSLQDQRSAPVPAAGPARTARADAPDPWAWRQTVAGDTLVLGVVGERGQSTVTGRFTPEDTDLEWQLFCDTGARPGTSIRLTMAYSVNGRSLGSVGCGESASAAASTGFSFDESAAANRAAWERNGLRAGQQNTVRAWVENRRGERVDGPDVRLGFALYRRTAPRIQRGNVVIPTLVDSGGQTYRLDDYTIEPLTDADRSARLAVPAAEGPRIVQSGVVQGGFGARQRVTQYVDGRVTGGAVGGGRVGAPLKDRGAHVLGVRAVGGEARGSLVIAVYERSADRPR